MQKAEKNAKETPQDRDRPDYQTRLEIQRGRFYRCWIFPGATQAAFKYCRKFVAADGTFTKTLHRLVLLLLVTVDGRENNLPLAWALVPVEDEDNWTWFLEGVKPYLEGLNHPDAVNISDRQKGLTNAIQSAFPRTKYSHCCQHIAENIRARFGGVKSGCVKLFWRAARAKTGIEFEEKLADIKRINEDCETYLRGIPARQWAFHAFPTPRYGYDTSNIVESVNSHCREGRDLPAFRLLVWIWSWLMDTFYKRLHQWNKHPRLTDSTITYLDSQKNIRMAYNIQSSAVGIGSVTAYTGRQRIISLQKQYCSCGNFRERRVPCRHALHLCKEQGLDREDYISRIYSLEKYRATYQYSFPPLSSEGLSSDETCQAPFFRRLPGRPTTARQRAKPDASSQQCSQCGEAGHNRRRCNRPRRDIIPEDVSEDDFSKYGNDAPEPEDVSEDESADSDAERRGRELAALAAEALADAEAEETQESEDSEQEPKEPEAPRKPRLPRERSESSSSEDSDRNREQSEKDPENQEDPDIEKATNDLFLLLAKAAEPFIEQAFHGIEEDYMSLDAVTPAMQRARIRERVRYWDEDPNAAA